MVTPRLLTQVQADNLAGLAGADAYFNDGDYAEIRLPLDRSLATSDTFSDIAKSVKELNRELLSGEENPPMKRWPNYTKVAFLEWNERRVIIRYIAEEQDAGTVSSTPSLIIGVILLIPILIKAAVWIFRIPGVRPLIARFGVPAAARIGSLPGASLFFKALQLGMKTSLVRRALLALNIVSFGALIFTFLDTDQMIDVLMWPVEKVIDPIKKGLKGIGAPILIGIAVIGVGVILLSAAPSAAVGLGARRLISGRND